MEGNAPRGVPNSAFHRLNILVGMFSVPGIQGLKMQALCVLSAKQTAS